MQGNCEVLSLVRRRASFNSPCWGKKPLKEEIGETGAPHGCEPISVHIPDQEAVGTAGANTNFGRCWAIVSNGH
jgi:hypothetical protein